MVPKMLRSLMVRQARMYHQCPVLETATTAQVCSFTFQEDVQGLLPQRPRSEVKGLFSMPIYDRDQSVCQKRVERVLISTNPEKVIQGQSPQASQAGQTPTHKSWHVLRSSEELLQEAVVHRPMIFAASGSPWWLAGNKIVGDRMFAGLFQVETNTFQERREMQPINHTERYHLMNMPWRTVECLIVGKRAGCGEVLLVTQCSGDAAAHRRRLPQGQAHFQPRTA